MVGVARERAEAEVFVKRLGLVILGVNHLGVNHERTNTSDVRGPQRALHRIFQQPRPQSLPLPGCPNREAGKEHDRNRMTRQPLGQPFRRGGILALDRHV